MTRNTKTTTQELSQVSTQRQMGERFEKASKETSEPLFPDSQLLFGWHINIYSICRYINHQDYRGPSSFQSSKQLMDIIAIVIILVPFHSLVNCGSGKLGTLTSLKSRPSNHTFPTASPPKLDIINSKKRRALPRAHGYDPQTRQLAVYMEDDGTA